MSGYEKKLIKGVKPITRKELDAKYFPDYVSSEYQINTGQSLKRGGQINSKYFTGNDKEVSKDNSALKSQIIKILETTIAQNEAHKKFSNVFVNDEGFKKYLVYEIPGQEKNRLIALTENKFDILGLATFEFIKAENGEYKQLVFTQGEYTEKLQKK